MNTIALTDAEKLAVALMGLIDYFHSATHIQEGLLDMMGLHITEQEAINLGWLRRALGPGRLDDDWLVPAGGLAKAVAEARGSRVLAAWANYQERRAA